MPETPQTQQASPVTPEVIARLNEKTGAVELSRPSVRDKALRGGLGLIASERIAGLSGVMRSRLMTERLVLKTQNGTLGKETTEPVDAELADMNLNVGDQIHVHLPERTTAAVGGSGQQRKLPALLIAGLSAAAGGSLAPLVLLALGQLFGGENQPAPPTPAVPAVEGSDADTHYELEISDDNS